MIVDVTWDGVTLAKGATARVEAGGWFVELEQPMPVGTTLTLAGEATGTVRVARVHEGLGAGMVVRAVGDVVTSAPMAPPAATASDAAMAPPAAAASDAAAANGATAEAPEATGAEAAGSDAAKAPAGEGFGDKVETEEITNSGSNGKAPRKRRNSRPRIK